MLSFYFRHLSTPDYGATIAATIIIPRFGMTTKYTGSWTNPPEYCHIQFQIDQANATGHAWGGMRAASVPDLFDFPTMPMNLPPDTFFYAEDAETDASTWRSWITITG